MTKNNENPQFSMASDVCQNEVKHFVNDLVTFGMRVKQFGIIWLVGSDYFNFMATANIWWQYQNSLSKYRLTSIYYALN
jgi:hypothetical protein